MKVNIKVNIDGEGQKKRGQALALACFCRSLKITNNKSTYILKITGN
jgi:hypothetical protein